jgi:hypothetical protein
MKVFKKRVYKISQEEYELKEKRYRIAKLIFEEDDFAPLRDYIDNTQKSAEEMVLNNTIREVVQEGLINGVKTMFKTSRKEQVDELAGKYQAMRDLKATLMLWIKDYEDLKEQVDNKYVEISD